jgi:hypothetical protein
MNFWPGEYDAGASTSALKGRQDGKQHITQNIFGDDLDPTKESTHF